MNDAPTKLHFLAPISGLIIPISNLPDSVFAMKMVGQGVAGIALDPTSNELLAPIAGTVIQQHSAGHALTIRSADGIEVLLHIGVDTASLNGEGFTPLVKEGEAVRQGQPLIRFDIVLLASKARSLLTQMLVVTGGRSPASSPAAWPLLGKRKLFHLNF